MLLSEPGTSHIFAHTLCSPILQKESYKGGFSFICWRPQRCCRTNTGGSIPKSLFCTEQLYRTVYEYPPDRLCRLSRICRSGIASRVAFLPMGGIYPNYIAGEPLAVYSLPYTICALQKIAYHLDTYGHGHRRRNRP